MVNVAIDRNRISNYFKATVSVTSDLSFTAIEARATKKGSGFGREVGICLLSDDAAASDGVVTLPSAVKNFTFDAESSEILTDGEYRISVFVLTDDGKWNDGSLLFTSSSETVYDTNGNKVYVKRDGSGTDEVYTSVYSGAVIDSFIAEVLS